MGSLWLVFGLFSALFASLVAIFGKIGLKSVDANTATAVRAIIMAVFLLVIVLFQGNLNKIPLIISNKKTFSFIILSGIAGALSWLFYFLALKFGSVAKVAPIDKLSVVVATVLSVLFFGEKISKLNGVGVGFITIGAILVALS